MTVRTLTLDKSKLTDTGLALLDWGFWSGKPDELGEQITVPVWRDAEYSHTVFQITVHPPGRIYDNDVWSIGKRDLALLQGVDVHEWWNRMAEAIMARVDRENVLITLPEHLNRLPTQRYSRVTPKEIKVHTDGDHVD
jgi:hypothetical protein